MAFHESARAFVHLGPGALAQTEMGGPEGIPRPHVRPLWDVLGQMSPGDLRERQAKLQTLSNELGIHFHRGDLRQTDETNWQLDLLPRVIDPAEWAALEAGILQRGRAFSQFVADIYGRQAILRDRVLPHDLVFDDPTFFWECLGLPQPRQGAIVTGAVDLARDRAGHWCVTQNHFSTPVGASFAIQHRRMLTQAFPELFQALDIRPVSPFSTGLVEALSSLSPRPNPHIVMLARGDSTDAWFEESFLARRMGVAMVKPADLLVRGDRVFLKTIGGLEKIDVIYRRISSASLDPIAFGAPGAQGIPGLLNCVRSGSVVIANAPGSGIADNKALLPHSDAIIRYYLNEEPLLATATTYHCADRDQREYVRDHLDTILLKPIHRDQELPAAAAAADPEAYTARMKRLLDEKPELVVGQPYIDASLLPRFEDGRFLTRPAYLRAFVLLGDSPNVMPGGLTRQAAAADPHLRIADLAGGAKDTWIPATPGVRRPARRPLPAAPTSSPRDFRIGSRVAESLYWIGRYCERAEHTARMIRVMEEAGWAQLDRRERLNIWPLWQAIAASTGQEDVLAIGEPPAQISDLTAKLVVDNVDPASLLSCVRFARANAGDIREFITPEVWIVLNRFASVLEKSPPQGRLIRTGQIADICQYCIDEIACLHGTILRTMPHDDGFQFWRAGMMIERAISTVTMLDISLTSAITHSDPATPLDPDLTLLLRLLGSLDAYQREYRSRTHLAPVAELLLKNEETPSALAYSCAEASTALRHLLKNMRAPRYRGPLIQTEQLRQHIRQLRTDVLFPAPDLDADHAPSHRAQNLDKMRRRFEKEIHHLTARLTALHELIEDTFFSHQHPAIPAPRTKDQPSLKAPAR
jgi:uncharacterized circularly permuted ATP-grasp superfamily protein/uncharacterized alpha-E superfamily protein